MLPFKFLLFSYININKCIIHPNVVGWRTPKYVFTFWSDRNLIEKNCHFISLTPNNQFAIYFSLSFFISFYRWNFAFSPSTFYFIFVREIPFFYCAPLFICVHLAVDANACTCFGCFSLVFLFFCIFPIQHTIHIHIQAI